MIDYIISALPFFKTLLIIPVMTFLTTYSISAIKNTQNYPYYFLSSSIDTKPASSVGTFGLSLTSVLIPIVSTIRYEYVKNHITNCENNLDKNIIFKANKKGLKLSIFSSFGALGVASFQDGIDKCGGTIITRIIHLLFAFIFFSGGLAYGYFSHKLDILLPDLGTLNERLMRKWLWYFSVFQIILQTLNIGLLVSSPTDSFIFTMSLLEIMLLLTLIAVYSTFYGEMKKIKIKIRLDNDNFYNLNDNL
jgi:hypothetical protein